MADDLTAQPGQQAPPTSTADPSAQPRADAPPSAEPGQAPPGKDGWVPSYRIREATERADRAEREARELREQLEARIEQQEARIKAAFGVDQPDPRSREVREQLFGVVPELQSLTKLASRVEELETLLEQGPRLNEFQQQYWTQAGHRMFDDLDGLMKDGYGDEPPKFAKQAAYSAFIAYVQSDPQAAQRYDRLDPGVVRDFWTAYTGGVLEPHRQHFSKQEQSRRAAAARVPRGGPGTDVIPGKKEKKTFKDLDEAIDAAADLSREARGG